ncbi:Pentatricopeptide repeat-containing protein At3g48810 [Linum perenne]
MFYMIGEFGCKPTVKMYNLFLDALLSENKFEMVSSAYKNMKEDHMEPNVYTYNTLLKAMCKNNRVDAAQKLLLQMSSKGCDLDVIIYTTVVSCMCNIDKMDEAKDLATRFQPSMPTYNALIKGFTKNHRIPEVFQLLDRMVEDGSHHLLNRYKFTFRHILTFAVFGNMFIRGCSPNLHTFSSLMKGYFMEGRLHGALDLWDRMISEGCAHIHGLCSCGRMGEALHVFNSMERNGRSLSITTYGAVMDGFAKSGDLHGASET